MILYFNPRSLTGATPGLLTISNVSRISIHAPLRERHNLIFNEWFRDEFQSTLPYGSDVLFLRTRVCSVPFQSTLPYGSDRREIREKRRNFYFNPRSLTGATGGVGDAKDAGLISIHAPLRERRNTDDDKVFGYQISIHAPLRERHTGL